MMLITVFSAMAAIVLFAVFFMQVKRVRRVSLAKVLNRQMGEDTVPEKEEALQKLENELLQSGTGITLPIYFLIMGVGAVLLYILGAFLIESPLAGILAACIAIFIPKVVVDHQRNVRMREFESMLAKALKHMSASLRTGSTIVQAVEGVIKAPNMPQRICEEMEKVRLDYYYGGDMKKAFANLYERTGCEEIEGIILAVEISETTGTSLYEAFDSYVTSITTRKESEAEARASLASVRMSTNIVACAPFVFAGVLKFISPDYFAELYTYGGGIGRFILLALFAFVGIGYVVVHKMCEIKL